MQNISFTCEYVWDQFFHKESLKFYNIKSTNY